MSLANLSKSLLRRLIASSDCGSISSSLISAISISKNLLTAFTLGVVMLKKILSSSSWVLSTKGYRFAT
uniref:Uncharacterized protein n=1 Tax=uncultured marine virus TaxID=186617 RepID=A0A0F7L9A1_9VIRU|nr:hypothetical protein [uncultured marine virus]